MTTQLQTQKKAPTAAAPIQQGFQPRAFPALQAKEDESLTEQPELHAQLDRAEQFGHSLGNLQTNAAPTTAVQAKANPIQREAAGGGGFMEMLMPMIMQLLPTLLPMLIGLI